MSYLETWRQIIIHGGLIIYNLANHLLHHLKTLVTPQRRITKRRHL